MIISESVSGDTLDLFNPNYDNIIKHLKKSDLVKLYTSSEKINYWEYMQEGSEHNLILPVQNQTLHNQLVQFLTNHQGVPITFSSMANLHIGGCTPIGPQLLSNGDFELGDQDWSKVSATIVNHGTFGWVTNIGNLGELSQSNILSSDTEYTFSFHVHIVDSQCDMEVWDANGLQLTLSSPVADSAPDITLEGNFTTGTLANGDITFKNVDGAAHLDSFSIKTAGNGNPDGENIEGIIKSWDYVMLDTCMYIYKLNIESEEV